MSSNTQILEEAPVWTINGVNTTFTITQAPVTNGLFLALNGLAQSSGVDYTFVGTTISFVVAPPTGSVILAKIITTIEITPSGGSLTLSDITDRIYTKMGIKSDSTVFDRSTIVIPKLNRVVADICAGQVTNIMNPAITYKSGFLRFLAKKFFFKTHAPVKLTASTTGGTISFDTTLFESSGYIIINEDVIAYTGKTATTITGVSGLSYNHDSGSIVEQIYELPTNAGKNFNLWDIDNKRIDPIKFQDDRAQKDFSPYWTLKFDSSTDKEFIYVNNIDNTNFILDYYAKSVDMSADSDTSTLSDAFMEGVAIPLTAGLLLYAQYGDDTLGVRWKSLLQDGYHSLQSLYGQWAERVKEFRKMVKRPSWGHRANITKNTNFND